MFNTLPELLAAVAGFILSVLAEYIPAYQRLDDKYKRLVMLAALIVAAALAYGFSCAPFLATLLGMIAPGVVVTCDVAGVLTLVEAFIAALAANQAAFGLLFRGKPAPVQVETAPIAEQY